MKESFSSPIDLAYITASPHRKAYEKFLQLDRYGRKEDFDSSDGLYKMARDLLGTFEWASEDSLLVKRLVYPRIKKSGKRPTQDNIIGAVDGLIDNWEKSFFPRAGSDVRAPDGTVFLRAGQFFSKKILISLAKYNAETTNPIKDIYVLSYQNIEEDSINKLISQQGDRFDGALLKRKRNVNARITGYRLKWPAPLDELDPRAPEFTEKLDDLAWRLMQQGKSLNVIPELEFELKEKTILFYDEKPLGKGTFRVSNTWRPLGNFPLFTSRDTFVIKGQERVPVIQLLPREGILVESDPTESKVLIMIKPEKGPSLKISSRLMKLKKPSKGSSSKTEVCAVKIDALGKEIDITEALKAWGMLEKFYEVFVDPYPEHPISHLPELDEERGIFEPEWILGSHEMFFGKDGRFHLGALVREELNKTLEDSFRALKITPPRDDDRLSQEDIFAIIHLLKKVSKDPVIQEKSLSDLDNLKAYLLHDQLRQRLSTAFYLLKGYIEKVLEKGPDPFLFLMGTIERICSKVYTETLCQLVDDTNPLAEISLKRKVTMKGPGGISHTQGMLPGRRRVHPSHYGRLCLAETPESEDMGLNLHLALAALVQDGELKTAYLPNGACTPEWLSFAEEKGKVIAPLTQPSFNQFAKSDKKVLARQDGQVVWVDQIDVTGREIYDGQCLGIAADLIPFVTHNDNNRVMMGAKNMKQAVPLLYPDAPLVKTGLEGAAAIMSGHAVYAGRAGTVLSVSEEIVTVQADEGGQDTYKIRKLRPTFHGTATLHRVRVRKGDRLKAGQAIADGECTRDGELALGVNLLVAYMPYYGLNFEDGIVISGRLVKDDILTSLHLRAEVMEVFGDEDVEYKVAPGERLKADLLEFGLFKGRLVSPGRYVKKGERLFVKYKTSTLEALPGDRAKKARSEATKKAVELEKTYCCARSDGTVTAVEEVPVIPETVGARQVKKRLVCWILEERKVAVGDKLMGRHGNKGVVSRIVPACEMPHLADGTPVDIILNPHGVISRMNLGQIMETHLGWILKQGGEKYSNLSTIPPFKSIQEDTIREAFKDLEAAGITPDGKAYLYDPVSGERIKNPVTVGFQYFMKLNHMVEDKIQARENGMLTLITDQPVKGKRFGGGQRLGEMEVWALLAHRGWFMLREFMTLKADSPRKDRLDISRNYLAKRLNEAPFSQTMRAAAMLLRGVGLELCFLDKQGNPLDIRAAKNTEDFDHISIRFAELSTIESWAAKKRVHYPQRPSLKRGAFKPEPGSIFDEEIFCDPGYDMGLIELKEAVIHPLLLNRVISFLGLLAELRDNMRAIIGYSAAYLPRDDGSIADGGIITYSDLKDKPINSRLLGGASFVEHLLSKLKDRDKQKLRDKNLHLMEYWPLKAIPVLPRNYRPVRAGQGAVVMSSSLNELYNDVILANNRLSKALKAEKSGKVLFLARASLQRAVNRLMLGDRQQQENAEKGIAGLIKGKEGILRMHMLGKRMDASARSVIVPMPELLLDQIGIPLELAAGLLRSKLIDVLAEKRKGDKPDDARKRASAILDNLQEPAYRELVKKHIFDEILADSFIVINRAPSLHKYNLLAFRPLCAEGKAIGLHPLVCGMFNADFDGDQMAVHLPLSVASKREAKKLLNPVKNMLSAANGGVMLHLTQDIALGIYILTSSDEGRRNFVSWFKGRLTDPGKAIDKKTLQNMVYRFHIENGAWEETAALAQKIMAEGFKAATLEGITFSIFDVPFVDHPERTKLLAGSGPIGFDEAVRLSVKKLCGM